MKKNYMSFFYISLLAGVLFLALFVLSIPSKTEAYNCDYGGGTICAEGFSCVGGDSCEPDGGGGETSEYCDNNCTMTLTDTTYDCRFDGGNWVYWVCNEYDQSGDIAWWCGPAVDACCYQFCDNMGIYYECDWGGSCDDGGNGGGPTPSTFSVAMDTVKTVNPGGEADYGITISPNSSGYAGTVNLDMAGTCPANATCTFSPTSVTITDTTPQYSTLTIITNSSIALGTYPITARGTDTVPDPDLTDSFSATLEVIANPANQAICDGTWRQTPGGGNTPSQPVGTNVQAGLSVSPLSPSVGLVIRGTDNQVYYRNCIFSGSECLWNGWSGLGGSTLYSPYTFTGDGWDVIMKNADNNSWAKVDWWWGWDANWSNRGASWESWGGLYRFNDVKGRTWQLRRNADTTISYACGANVCILPAFDSSKSSVSPITVNVNDNVNIRCDMSVRDADFISPSFTGASNCVFNGYDVTTALFTCKATQAGINIPVNCNTSNIPPPGSNFCASSSTIGTLTVAVVNQPPTVPNVTVTEPDYCSSGPAVYVNWTYSDPDGDPQSAYQVQVSAGGSSWNPPLSFDSGKVSGSGTSYFASGLAFDITYKARVRVWDSNDNVSAWKDSGSWKTPKHAYPFVDFTYSPLIDIPAKQPVQFTDSTTFYDGGGGIRTWSWVFGDGGTSSQQNQSHTYNLPGLYNSSLTATDKDNYSCSRTKPITIQLPVPVWKEVSPR